MVLRLSVFADEAASSIDDQLAVVRELGWRHIDLRKVDDEFVHDLSLARVEEIAVACRRADVAVASVGSAIANGRARIEEDESVAVQQAERCAERLPLLGCTDLRIMSWPPGERRDLDEPTATERFRRLRLVVERCRAAGLRPLHENCHNYGGQSVAHTERLLEEVPGLELIFDSANPIGTLDQAVGEPRPRQSPWDFWCGVRDRVLQVHIKDACWDPQAQRPRSCLPGHGQGDVAAILADLVERDFDGVVSIEPHLGTAGPGPGRGPLTGDRRGNVLAAGRRLQAMLEVLGADWC